MAPVLVSRAEPLVRLSAANAQSGSTDNTVTNPGCVDGELLIAVQTQRGSGTAAAMTSNDGFTQRGATNGSATYGWMKVWYRVASNEPASWSWSKNADGVVTVLVIKGFDWRPDHIFDVEPTFSVGGPTTTTPALAITTSEANSRIICAFASETGGATHTTPVSPAGFVEHKDTAVPASNNHSVCAVAAGAPTAYGPFNSTSSSSQRYITVSMAISSPPAYGAVNYAPSITMPYWSTDQNAMVMFIGANSTGGSGDLDCQVSSVIDDAHNVWVQGPDSFINANAWDPYIAGRVSIWYTTNASPITSVTVTMNQTVDGLAVQVAEYSGVTNVASLDFYQSDGSAADVTTRVAAGTTTNASDVIVAAAVVCDSSVTLTHVADTWSVFPNVDTVGALTVKDDVLLRCAMKILSSAGAQSTTWNLSAGRRAGWAILALKGGTVSTANPNPNWPQMTHEIGFGSDPNDPATTISYTNVTTKITKFASQRGRDYELARTEAGEADVHVNNFDGRFDPTNTGSIYYPDVKVLTPYRCRATWNGTDYNIFTGYVERWPQKWEDELGGVRMQTVDGLATLAGSRLAGALGEEIIQDDPWAYWPLDDGRLADQAANKATISSTPLSIMTSVNGGGTAGFGYDLSLQSESSTCWQQDRLSTALDTDAPNAVYGKNLSANMTLPQLSTGVLMECWASVKPTSATQNYTLLALKAEGFTAQTQRRVVVLQLDSNSGLPTLYRYDSGATLFAYPATIASLNDATFHHYVVHATTSTLRLWIDGTLRVDQAVTSMPATTIDRINVGGEADPFQPAAAGGNIASGAQFAHVAVYQLATTDDRRIAARANAGLNGFPEKTGARISRILRYGGWAGPQAIDDGLSYLGATSTIPRQTLLAAVQDVASWENGLAFVDGSGNFRFVGRDTRFNQNIKYIFGGMPGEIPYETDVEIDYDPKYVFNDVTITRVLGSTPGTGATLTGSSSSHKLDQPSIKSYFDRFLDKTTGVASISQLQDEAVWTLENYAQPRARLAHISITPSANPSLWPVALGIEIGDRVLVRRQPFGGADIELDCYVEQVGHQVEPGKWKTVLSLSPVLLTTYGGQAAWILDASTLNVDTIVG